MSLDAPYEVQIHRNMRLPTSDGLTLSANLFMPVAREPGETFPAILEMIPYRKDDWRSPFDRQLMTYFAQRGFAGCRLVERGYDIHIRFTGTLRATEVSFHIDVQLAITLNGSLFCQKSWLESVPRRLV